MQLYHGSSLAIEHPQVSFNTGFADLGQGFYLTDDVSTAQARARSRARIDGAACGIVSVFEFSEDALSWLELGAPGTSTEGGGADPFGLRFAQTRDGITAWANYIKSCRAGKPAVQGVGNPDVVRAWIATEDVEMVCAGFAPAEALAEFIDPASLVVQYCFRTQRAVDELLAFAEARQVP